MHGSITGSDSYTAAPPAVSVSEEAVRALIALLNDADPTIRLDAAKALLDARRDGIA